MERWWQLLLGLWMVMPVWAGDELLNVCMKTKHHKREPGPEDKLYEECIPWAEKACCTASTSWHAHLDVSLLYNFSLLHCGLMMPGCEEHFIQAVCFYECSPNLGPWIQKVGSSGQGERIRDAPLCWEDCEQWWEDCRTSYTCRSDWLGSWDWSRGKSRCPCGGRLPPFPALLPHARRPVPEDLERLLPGEPRAQGQRPLPAEVAVARLFAAPARARAPARRLSCSLAGLAALSLLLAVLSPRPRLRPPLRLSLGPGGPLSRAPPREQHGWGAAGPLAAGACARA
ncbi:sperm-egg fusion protein Juno isoform X3 [Canis lupus familiaris]|uniref:sperm-egg fusion protein Juno isoform X3 n=1 Tax=Canis lupus familiaris TaxID=9615 RepID=UPI0018F5B773|nr:sperm-egg fusion protein Juno isoform X3 [Canis lupus familiaris]